MFEEKYEALLCENLVKVDRYIYFNNILSLFGNYLNEEMKIYIKNKF